MHGGIGKGGKVLDIHIIDHLVVGKESWVSLKERGLGL